MLEVVNSIKIKPKRPKVKQGDIISFNYEGDIHIGLFYRETDDSDLKLVSLNHEISVWSHLVEWWDLDNTNSFTDVEILSPGTTLTVM